MSDRQITRSKCATGAGPVSTGPAASRRQSDQRRASAHRRPPHCSDHRAAEVAIGAWASRRRPVMEQSEIAQLRAVWELVEPDKVNHGVEILIRLFDRFPETKAKFKRLNTSSAEAMRQSARVRAHAGRVLVSLGSVIASLEDAEMVDETIFLLGDSHNRRGVTPDDFQVRCPNG
ncbi:Myoglobin [Amphibalanus amphitrite]|uniref:Nitrite reductase MB n=1 Tax=Amphibalanus amphitrite TaxID=1232801 RepID=A0A6A4X2K3_AMPAM|nr:Myoglobin [Amphibalanus amphitrite]